MADFATVGATVLAAARQAANARRKLLEHNSSVAHINCLKDDLLEELRLTTAILTTAKQYPQSISKDLILAAAVRNLHDRLQKICHELQSYNDATILQKSMCGNVSDVFLQENCRSLKEWRREFQAPITELATKPTEQALEKSWHHSPPMTQVRHGSAAVILNGTIVVLGGSSNVCYMNKESTLSSVERFDPLTCAWTDLPCMSTPRRFHAAAVVSDKIYAIGGAVAMKSVECFDQQAGIWTNIAPMNMERGGLAAVACNGLIYAIGGETPDEHAKFVKATNTVECFDPFLGKWNLVKPMSLARVGLAATASHGYIYVLGGHFNGSGLEERAALECCDVQSYSWTLLPCMRVPRIDCAAVASAGFIYVLGGKVIEQGPSRTSKLFFDSCECFDVERSAWADVQPMRGARSGTSAVMLGEHIYLFGGKDSGGVLNSVERFGIQDFAMDGVPDIHHDRNCVVS